MSVEELRKLLPGMSDADLVVARDVLKREMHSRAGKKGALAKHPKMSRGDDFSHAPGRAKQRSPEKQARVDEMADLYRYTTMTLAQIGERFGLTRERVRRLLHERADWNDMCVNRIDAFVAALDMERESVLQEYGSRVWEAFKRLGWWKLAFDEQGVPDSRKLRLMLREAFPEDERLYMRYPKGGGRQRQYELEDGLKSLRRAAEALGRSPGVTAYNSLGFKPSSAWIMQRFGKWSNALELAGLPSSRTWGHNARGNWDLRFTDEDCKAAVRACQAASGGAIPTYEFYSEWARGRDDVPSSTLVRNRLATETRGSWVEVVQRVYREDADAA